MGMWEEMWFYTLVSRHLVGNGLYWYLGTFPTVLGLLDGVRGNDGLAVTVCVHVDGLTDTQLGSPQAHVLHTSR